MLSHHLFNFVFATSVVIAFLYLVYLFIRQNPQLVGGLGAGPRLGAQGGRQQGLRIESALSLDARKRLYVIREGQQRFLIATTMDKTELLATLEPAGADADTSPGDLRLSETLPQSPASPTSTDIPDSLAARLSWSFKRVWSDRFPKTGGY